MSGLNDIKLFEKLAERSKLVPIFIRVPIILIAFGIAGYWIFNDSGPYEYVADFQARLFHWKHYPIISGLCALIVSLVPALIVIYLLSIAYSKRKSE